jgi:response regulator RpfG family c-di-GMP phosphodiesterase
MEPMTHETIVAHLEEHGGHSNPEVLKAFLDEVPL